MRCKLVNTNSVQRMDHDMNWGPDEAVPYMYVNKRRIEWKQLQ
jgi:hypothetical protein